VIIWFVSLPALVVLLALADQLLLALGKAGLVPWRRERGERPVSATGFEVLHASLAPGKAQELKQRQVSLVLREDEESGAPRSRAVDLDSGRIVLRRAEGSVQTVERGAEGSAE
jgi:Family of unknown function (DUF6191)